MASGRTRHTTRLLSSTTSEPADRLRDLYRRLLEAIAEVARDPVVVDSSKFPADAALACTAPGVDVHLVHLVRDPRAVAWSWQRTKMLPDVAQPRPIQPHSPLASSVQWVAWNALIERVSRYATSTTRIRYEDFVADPGPPLRRIVARVGLAPSLVDRVVRDDVLDLLPNHTVTGNPSRFSVGPVRLGVDDAWREDQPHVQRLAASLPALPLLRRYGYPVTPSRSSSRTPSGEAG